MAWKRMVSVLAVLLVPLVLAGPTFQLVHTRNELRHAVWLGHGWVNGTPVQSVAELLTLLARNGVHVLFVNMGRLDAQGLLRDGTATLAAWLRKVRAWETAHGLRFEVWAWLAADTSQTNIGDPLVRQRIVDEVRRLLTEARAHGRGFDGVLMDVEPVGRNPKVFEAYLQLISRIRQAAGAGYGIGVAAPRFSPKPETEWFWGPAEFQRMARHADVLVMNTYNSGLRSERGDSVADYADWVAGQVRGVLDAVFEPPDARPQAAPSVRLFFGAPAYPEQTGGRSKGRGVHDPTVETVSGAVRGVRTVLAELAAAGEEERARLVRGMALYAHTDGSGRDGYASRAHWTAWSQALAATAALFR